MKENEPFLESSLPLPSTLRAGQVGVCKRLCLGATIDINESCCTMSLSYLQPYAGAHAVQQATFVIAWAPMERGKQDGATERVLAGIAVCFAELGLLDVKPVQMVELRFGPTGPIGQPPTAAAVGYEARMVGAAGRTFASVTATAVDGLSIHVQEYTRWSEVFSKVQPILHAVLPMAAEAASVVKVGLQVVDSFTWNGPVNDVPIDNIFRRPSPWLPEHAFKCRSFWHAHHGYFEDSTEEGCHRQLTNINVNVGGSNDKPIVQAVLLHNMELTEGGCWPRGRAELEWIDRLLQKLHQDNKAAIGGLFSDEIVGRVALWGDDGWGDLR